MYKNNKLNTRDFVTLGIMSALFFVIYFAVGMITALINPVLHIFSPAIGGLFTGIVYLTMVSKIKKPFISLISSIIFIILIQFTGGTYFPWVVTVLLSSLISDLINYKSLYTKALNIKVGFGIMMLGQAMGNVLPVIFFASKFKEEFVSRGVDTGFMDLMINFIEGPMSIVILVVSFICGYLGISIGLKFMKKHFEKAGVI